MSSGREKMVEERRQHQRLVPNAPLFVSLDESKSGLLLDLCEGGLSVASLLPRSLDEIVSVSFDLPEGIGRIEAKAKITWTRDAGHLTGVRFIEVGGQAQYWLNEWISTGTDLRLAPIAEAAEPVLVARSTFAQVDPISAQVPDQSSADLRASLPEAPIVGVAQSGTSSHPVATAEPGRKGKSRYAIELFLAILGLSWALVFLGYRMGVTGASRQMQEVTAAPRLAEAVPSPELASATGAPAEKPMLTPVRTPVPVPSPASAKPAMDSGVVLQVGAMKLENHAATLARDLRRKKFPAVVFRNGSDKLYRVAVGPYSDADSTGKVKQQLEKQGFKPMLQHWAAQ
jgi:cell division septation protein DedD